MACGQFLNNDLSIANPLLHVDLVANQFHFPEAHHIYDDDDDDDDDEQASYLYFAQKR